MRLKNQNCSLNVWNLQHSCDCSAELQWSPFITLGVMILSPVKMQETQDSQSKPEKEQRTACQDLSYLIPTSAASQAVLPGNQYCQDSCKPTRKEWSWSQYSYYTDVQWITHFDLNLLVLLPLPYACTHAIEDGYGWCGGGWNYFVESFSSTFTWIPRIELGLLGFCNKHLYHVAGPRSQTII